MSETLALTFDTDEATRKFNINAPKADLDRDTVEAAMQAVVDSGAFEDLIGVVKGVLTTRESEIIFEN